LSSSGTTPTEQLIAALRVWLAERIKAGESPADLYPDLLRCFEPVLLDEVMRRVQGNRWVAAKWLGLNRATVRKKLGVYGLTDAHKPPSGGVAESR
jgi:DNA-binding protein Fis